MWLLYDLLIRLYGFSIRVASLFDPKARAWVAGRRTSPPGPLSKLERGKRGPGGEGGEVAWFHCASLGEFEQGRPVLEAFRAAHPGWKIVLTFFSPSGFEVRKNYEGADLVLYLPLDTRKNAREFIRLINPSLAIFVKYEFWFRYLDELHRNNIPTFVISAIFRPNHPFFKWYRTWPRKQLKKVTRYFVQNEESAQLLRNFGIDRVTVSGDTRFDRVAELAKRSRPFPLIEKFARQMPVFLAGSTWPPDEELILDLISSHGDKIKFIIAPHEVGEARVSSLRLAVGGQRSAVGFSQLTEENATSTNILIVDGIGYLSHLYKYATIAYIGGGFGAGIHNILEAATYGKPVIFGPKYQKFKEATDLVQFQGAISINNAQQLNNRTMELLDDPKKYQQASTTCSSYVQSKTGATQAILHFIDGYLQK
jgi:3-deoxy-D-manno-octulosonic-acid transferase